MNNESSQNVKTTKKRTDAAKVGGAKRYFKSKSTGGAIKQAAKGAAPAKAAKKQPAKPAAATQAKKQPAKTAAKPQQKRRYSKKANGTPLHIIPLGGLDEIGKNVTVYEYNGEMILVDCILGIIK